MIQPVPIRLVHRRTDGIKGIRGNSDCRTCHLGESEVGLAAAGRITKLLAPSTTHRCAHLMSIRRLVYGFDPLCGWCYGFGPVMERLTRVRPELPIELVLGGLVTGDRVGPYARMVDYIRGASEQMTAVTGQALSEKFFALIEDPTTLSASAPPSWVLMKVREAHPSRVLDYARVLQSMHFQEGQDLNAIDTHLRVARRIEVTLPDVSPFPEVTDTHPEIASEFDRARTLDIASFPTVFAITDDGSSRPLPTEYDPDRFFDLLEAIR